MICVDCGQQKPITDFPVWSGRVQQRCRSCQTLKNQRNRAARQGLGLNIPAQAAAIRASQPATPDVTEEPTVPTLVSDSPKQAVNAFHASASLITLFDATVRAVADGEYADTYLFLGPSGCGKTTSAEHLAERAGLPFVKVDVAAMTDPESWFGTREVEAVDGTSVTTYRPSTFVEWVQQPCVLLLDEINRVRDEHRNIILPLTDGTFAVTNPLTGETVKRHPGCIIVMSGNRGLQFTGTYAVDPALMTRAYVLEFSYLPEKEETKVVLERYPRLHKRVASTLVRLANETRQRAAKDPDFIGVSTREVLAAAKQIQRGVDPDLAISVSILNVASTEGGEDSVRAAIQKIWVGIRPLMYGTAEAEPDQN